jgi:hypothetical protein
VAPKLTRAEWLKLSPEAKRALAAMPKAVAKPKASPVKKGGESRLAASGKRK